jgi:hypothetical protein
MNGLIDLPASDHAWRIAIANASGRIVKRMSVDAGNTHIRVADLPNGNYSAMIIHDRGALRSLQICIVN